jgi:hypothetical protein
LKRVSFKERQQFVGMVYVIEREVSI